jgi:hypothetical protein
MSQFVDFVQSSGVKCDFLSFRGKGEWDGCLNATPNLQSVVDAADQTAQLAQAAGLSSITIINDEADMRVLFALPFKPRMTEQFPAGSDDAELPLVGWTQNAVTGNASFTPAAFGQQRSIMTAASTWPSGECPLDLPIAPCPVDRHRPRRGTAYLSDRDPQLIRNPQRAVAAGHRLINTPSCIKIQRHASDSLKTRACTSPRSRKGGNHDSDRHLVIHSASEYATRSAIRCAI